MTRPSAVLLLLLENIISLVFSCLVTSKDFFWLIKQGFEQDSRSASFFSCQRHKRALVTILPVCRCCLSNFSIKLNATQNCLASSLWEIFPSAYVSTIFWRRSSEYAFISTEGNTIELFSICTSLDRETLYVNFCNNN